MKEKTFIILILLFSLCSSLKAEDVREISIGQLIKMAKEFDGKTVIIKGEVIGDIMPRGNWAWLNIEDKEGTVGVWLPKTMTSIISFKGDYKHKGDLIAVEGKFQRADSELNGELCVRAQRIEVLQRGEKALRLFRPERIKTALWLSFLVFGLGVMKSVLLKEKVKFR